MIFTSDNPPSAERIVSEQSALDEQISMDQGRRRVQASVLLALSLAGTACAFVFLPTEAVMLLMMASLFWVIVGGLTPWVMKDIPAVSERLGPLGWGWTLALSAALFALVLGVLVGWVIHTQTAPLEGEILHARAIMGVMAQSVMGSAFILFWVGQCLNDQAKRVQRREALAFPEDEHCLEVEQWLGDPVVRRYVQTVAQQGRELVQYELDGLQATLIERSQAQVALVEQEKRQKAYRNVYMSHLDSPPQSSNA